MLSGVALGGGLVDRGWAHFAKQLAGLAGCGDARPSGRRVVPAVSRCFSVASRLTIVLCSSVAVPAGSATIRETAAASCHCPRTFCTHWCASTRDYRGWSLGAPRMSAPSTPASAVTAGRRTGPAHLKERAAAICSRNDPRKIREFGNSGKCSNIRNVAPDPGSCTRETFVAARQGPEFFVIRSSAG